MLKNIGTFFFYAVWFIPDLNDGKMCFFLFHCMYKSMIFLEILNIVLVKSRNEYGICINDRISFSHLFFLFLLHFYFIFLCSFPACFMFFVYSFQYVTAGPELVENKEWNNRYPLFKLDSWVCMRERERGIKR